MSENVVKSADIETGEAGEKIDKKRPSPDAEQTVREKPLHVKKHREGEVKPVADIQASRMSRTSSKSTFVELLESCDAEHPEKDNIIELGLLFQKLKKARNACLQQYDSFISQDPANFMGMNGFEKEHGAGIDFEQLKAHAKLMMPLVVSTVEHMSKNLTTARTNIIMSHKKVKLESPDLLSKPAYSTLKKLKQPTGVDETINTVESMRMGVMCFRLNQMRPPRPEKLEAKLNQGGVDLEALLEDVAEAMNSFKQKVSLHIYFKMSLAMITFLKELFVGIANIAKKNYLMKFGEAIDSLPTKDVFN